MTAPFIEAVIPIALLIALALPFGFLARRSLMADRTKQRKARHLTGSAKGAVLGAVGNGGDTLSAHYDCGMVSREANGQIIIVRQARLTQDTLEAL